MQDMINRGLVNISQISLYPDEADEMLNMGFYEDIVNIPTTPDEKTHGYSLQQCLLK
jgi:ATP-dependent RNA helicase DeaD